jgi:hypothetical protein
MGKMKHWDFWTSIIAGVIYFVVAEDRAFMLAFLAIMSYLFYIDDKIDKQ